MNNRRHASRMLPKERQPIVRVGAMLWLVISLLVPVGAMAQVADPAWSPPYLLSTSTGEVPFYAHASAVDKYGNLHAVWSERSVFDDTYAIYHAYYDGERWTKPIDVYAAGPGMLIGRISLATHEDDLYVAWTSGALSDIGFMRANVFDAVNDAARAWSEQENIDGDVFEVTLLADDAALHIVYSQYFSGRRGIFHRSSEDGGTTWTEAEQIDLDIPGNFAPQEFDVILDDAGGLHLVWFYTEPEEPGVPGRVVQYAHSLDGGANWSTPIVVDEESLLEGQEHSVFLPRPRITSDGETITIVWGAGSPGSIQRYYVVSADRGLTWTNRVRIDAYGRLNGQAGDALLTDSQGRIHHLAQIRYPQAIYQGVSEAGRWSPAKRVYQIKAGSDEPYTGVHAHNIDAVLRAGNELAMFFTPPPTNDEEIQLYVMQTTVEDLPGQELPAFDPAAVRLQSVLATQDETAADGPSQQPPPDQPPSPDELEQALINITAAYDASNSIEVNASQVGRQISQWIAVLPTILLVAGILAVVQLRRRRRS